MSVLIKGMELPTGCKFCAMMRYYPSNGNVWCNATNRRMQYRDSVLSNRQEFCPLVEVPTPHGRLIDADAFKETIDYYIREANWSDAHNEALGWAKEFIDNEQAVIEAEVEDVASHTRQLARQAGKILVDAALNAIKESEGSDT